MARALLTLLTILLSTAVNADSSGILVQGKSNKLQKSKEFGKFLSAHKLRVEKQFKTLKVYHLRPESNKDISSLCKEALKLEEIVHCEVNQKLNPLTYEGCYEEGQVPIDSSISKMAQEIDCELVKRGPSVHRQKGLSTFWAQEYTGADLVREKLKKLNPDLTSLNSIVSVWDTSEDLHGTRVANLISGPQETSIIPAPQTVSVADLENTVDYIQNYETEEKKCREAGNCTAYINNSMLWKNSKLVEGVVERMSETSVFVVAPGNYGKTTEKLKARMEAEGKIVSVGSLAPDGKGSDFSDFSPSMTISAPSDRYVTSHAQGHLSRFGGTSGAAPQVTGALGAFTLISKYKLSGKEAQLLLKKTAIKFPHYPTPNTLGAGILNSYKIAEVALKVIKECEGKKRDCITQKLKEDSTYQFEVETQEHLALFPECTKGEEVTYSKKLCKKKKEAFQEIRKAALLNPENSELWNVIACVNENQGMTQNAHFYTSLSKRNKLSDEELISQLEKDEDPRHLLRYLLTHPNWRERSDLISKSVQNPKHSNEILNTILSSEQWKDRSDWLRIIIERSNDYNISTALAFSAVEDPKIIEEVIRTRNIDTSIILMVLSQPRWTKYPELVVQLLEKQNKEVDESLEKYLLTVPQWQKALAEKFQLKEVTLEGIRSAGL